MDTVQIGAAMTGNGKFTAGQLDDFSKLLTACGGLEGSVEAIASELSQLRPVVSNGKRLNEDAAAKSASWEPFEEIEEEFSGHSPRPGIGAYGNRQAGMREPWTAGDPEVIRIRSEILNSGKPIPRPHSALIDQFRELGEIEQSGNLVTCDGMPLPLGQDQIKHLVEIRWPYVRDELLVYASHSKAVSVSHDCLERLLTHSPRIHWENLILLQKHHPALFWAVWRRDFKAIEMILKKVGWNQLRKGLTSAGLVKDKDRKGKDRKERQIKKDVSKWIYRLMCGTALLSELERLSEIIACLHLNWMVTREGIKRFLKASTSIKEIVESDKPVATYLAASAAQIRGSHPSMNGLVESKHSDPGLRNIDQIAQNTAAYESDKPRLSKPFGQKPALYFIGIEQELIPLVAIIMLVEDMKQIKRNYRYRVKKGSSGNTNNIENEVVTLAAVIAAHVHIRWARALLNSLSKSEEDREWLEAGMPGKPVRKPKEDELKKLEEAERPFVGQRNHTRLYARARERVEQLPGLFEMGWSRGFFFSAWMMDIPEKSFLTKCATLQKFSDEGRIAHDRQMRKTAAAPFDGFSGAADTTWTGLPRENPVETQHDRMRRFINQIQVPDKIPRRFRKAFNRERDIFVAEVAKVFPAVTPFTLDPYLHDQITVPIDERLIEFAVEGAWYTTFDPSARGPSLAKALKASEDSRPAARRTKRGSRKAERSPGSKA
ncbi:MAG: hypothetical protein V2J51_06805 [Erythrobacter sp.]|nr:hypothetical protein [Erythrobacter sp.]